MTEIEQELAEILGAAGESLAMSLNRPGCFGLAVQHSRIDACRRCNHLSECRHRALATIQGLPPEIEVSGLLEEYSKIGDAYAPAVALAEEK